jgi:hypothetical protein
MNETMQLLAIVLLAEVAILFGLAIVTIVLAIRKGK